MSQRIGRKKWMSWVVSGVLLGTTGLSGWALAESQLYSQTKSLSQQMKGEDLATELEVEIHRADGRQYEAALNYTADFGEEMTLDGFGGFDRMTIVFEEREDGEVEARFSFISAEEHDELAFLTRFGEVMENEEMVSDHGPVVFWRIKLGIKRPH